METLTRVMARTVYRIDLLDPPLRQLTRKDKVMKRVQRKISSGDNLKKAFSTGLGGFQFQGQNTQARNSGPAGESSSNVVDLKPPRQAALPRSASEPGMLLLPETKNSHNHVHTLHSDSCVGRDLGVRTQSKELIAHEDPMENSEGNEELSEGILSTFVFLPVL